MRVVVTGASGNVGSALVEALGTDPAVESVLGVCRRPHQWRPDGVTWHWADIARDDLAPVLRGADAVVHLAWLFHPMRHPGTTWGANVHGTARLLEAVAAAEVPTFVQASSVGAYSPRTDLDPVDESWPTDGVPSSAYSREKAYVERLLDTHERQHPQRRVVRLRPGFTFQSRSSVQQRRLFLGPLVPQALLRPGRVPLVPLPREVRLQAVYSRDVAAAYQAAVTRQVHGAFNVAADPVLTPRDVADVLGSRWVPVPARLLRGGVAAGFGARALPTTPDLVDLLLQIPVMDASRARAELAWSPAWSAGEALASVLHWKDAAPPTPPLDPGTSGPLRRHELATGVGARA